MQRTNEAPNQGSRDLLGNLLSTIITGFLITVAAIQVPDLLIWLAR